MSETWLADLVDLDFRLRWWNRLTIDNPQVAARLIAKFPDRYPVVRETAVKREPAK